MTGTLALVAVAGGAAVVIAAAGIAGIRRWTRSRASARARTPAGDGDPAPSMVVARAPPEPPVDRRRVAARNLLADIAAADPAAAEALGRALDAATTEPALVEVLTAISGLHLRVLDGGDEQITSAMSSARDAVVRASGATGGSPPGPAKRRRR
ncbi:MAG: hypothetical protein ABMB14_00005 [Myxococcota bacterium]